MPADHNPVGWFEIPVHDLARAKDLLRKGLRLTSPT